MPQVFRGGMLCVSYVIRVVLFFSLLCIISHTLVHAAYQDFQSFTLSNPDNKVSLSGDCLSTSLLSTLNSNTYAVQDMGVPVTDAQHTFDTQITGGDVPAGSMLVWGVSDTAGDTFDDWNNGIYVSVYHKWAQTSQIFLGQVVNGVMQTKHSSINLPYYYNGGNTRFYLTVTKTGQSVTVGIYKDEARTQLWQTLSATMTVPDTMRYFYSLSSRTAGGANSRMSANVCRLDMGIRPQSIEAPVLNSAAPGDGQVTLSWSSVTDATAYYVYMGTTSGSYTFVNEVSQSDLSHTITGLTNGSPYYFVITATNGAQESDYSNELNATPGVLTVDTEQFVSDVQYNANGQIIKITYGTGTVTDYVYAPLNFRLQRLITTSAAGVKLQDFEYTYDNVGNIVAITDYVHTASQSFQYDALNRLSQAANPQTYGTKTYAYDEIGNIIQKDNKTYTYGENGAGPHAVTSLSDGSFFDYDANGNMILRMEGAKTTEYAYDAENRLTTVTINGTLKAEYSYDGDGGRVKKVVYDGGVPTTTKFVGNLYEESGTRTTNFIYLGDTRIASVTGTKVLFYHADHLGGANVITDINGVKKEITEYTPFGSIARRDKYGSDTEVAHWYFTGQREDAESGLYFYNARYYDPGLGRFVTSDTMVQSPTGNPQTFNRYSYTGNNPVNLVDPTGHWFWAAVIVGSLLGGASAAANDQPIWQGMLFGAMGGVFVGVGAADFGFWGAVGGGALSGGLNAAVSGGNIGVGMLVGGLGAGLGYGLGSWASGWNRGSFWGQLGSAAVAGGVAGGVGAELSGGRFGEGAAMGAAFSSAGFLAAQAVNSLDPRIQKAKVRQQQAKARHNLNVKKNDMIKVLVGRRPVSFFKLAGHEFLPGWEMGPENGLIKTTNTAADLSTWPTHIETQKAIPDHAKYTTAEVSASGLVEAIAWYEQSWVDTNTLYSGGSYNSNSAVNTVIYAAGGSVPNAPGWNPAFESVPSSIYHSYGHWRN